MLKQGKVCKVFRTSHFVRNLDHTRLCGSPNDIFTMNSLRSTWALLQLILANNINRLIFHMRKIIKPMLDFVVITGAAQNITRQSIKEESPKSGSISSLTRPKYKLISSNHICPSVLRTHGAWALTWLTFSTIQGYGAQVVRNWKKYWTFGWRHAKLLRQIAFQTWCLQTAYCSVSPGLTPVLNRWMCSLK